MPVFKNSINSSWGKLIYLCICILSLLRNYESFKYPHIQLTDTGGFISFIVKHKTGILKVKVYIEKSTFISQSIDHIIVANTFAGMCTSTLNTKNKPIFISTQKY